MFKSTSPANNRQLKEDDKETLSPSPRSSPLLTITTDENNDDVSCTNADVVDDDAKSNAGDDRADQSCSKNIADEGNLTKDIKFSSLEELMINFSSSSSF